VAMTNATAGSSQYQPWVAKMTAPVKATPQAPGPHSRVSSSTDLIGSSLNCARRGPITAGIASALGVWDDCASDSAGPYGR